MTPSALMQAQVDRWNSIRGSLFPAQQEAVFDEAPLRCWQCSRRAGKTTAAMTEFLLDALRYPEREFAYCALTRASAKNIAWPILRGLRRDFAPDMRLREALLRVEIPSTGSALTLYGADRPDWMDRLFGLKLAKVWLDEAPFFSIDLNYLVDEVLEPCVTDLEGSITLMSRPGFIEKGLFWEAATGKQRAWKVAKWGWEDNPHMRRQTQALIDRRSKASDDYLDLPSTRRNWFNEWISELGKRVYKFNWDNNSTDKVPWNPARPPELNYVLGVDLGWWDQTAFCVGVWSPAFPEWIEIESYAESEMQMDIVAARIRMYQEMYPGIMTVGDPAAHIAFEELRARYQLDMRAAEKTDKRHWIDAYNNDLVTGKIKILNAEKSPHVEEMLDLLWETKPGNKVVESPRSHNDVCDAALYAYRFAQHHRHTPVEERPTVGSAAYYDRVAQEMESEAEQKHARSRNGGW